jgi:hypothetical protein
VDGFDSDSEQGEQKERKKTKRKKRRNVLGYFSTKPKKADIVQ